MRQLALWAVICASPVLTAAVQVRGTGSGGATVRGNDFFTGTRVASATFDSTSSRYSPSGILMQFHFAHEQRSFEVSVDVDLRGAARGEGTVHFPDLRSATLRYIESRGAGSFTSEAQSGLARVLWAMGSRGHLSLQMEFEATVFDASAPTPGGEWREVNGRITFERALPGTIPSIVLAGQAPLPDPTVDVLAPSGCGGEGGDVYVPEPDDSPGCGGDDFDGGDSGPDCGGGSGDSAPDCGGGGGGGSAPDCAGAGGGAAPDCATGNVPCGAKKRRATTLRYVPYLAIFAFIYILRTRVRRRVRAAAIDQGPRK